MHLLPLSLGKIADVAAKNSTKFAIQAIRVRLHGDNTFIVEATDSKRLIRASGWCEPQREGEEYPQPPGFRDAPNGEVEALVDAGVWKSFFAQAAKITKSAYPHMLRSVAMKIGRDASTLAATNLTSSPIESTPRVEGRFPPVDEVIPKAGRGMQVVVDPSLLADTLKTISGMLDKEHQEVRLEICAGSRIIRLDAKDNDKKIVGVLMPLSAETEGRKASDNEVIAELNHEIEKAQIESARLRAELEAYRSGESTPGTTEQANIIANLKAKLEEAEADVTKRSRTNLDLEAQVEQLQAEVARLQQLTGDGTERLIRNYEAMLGQKEQEFLALESDWKKEREQTHHLQSMINTLQHNGRELANERDRLQVALAQSVSRRGEPIEPAKPSQSDSDETIIVQAVTKKWRRERLLTHLNLPIAPPHVIAQLTTNNGERENPKLLIELARLGYRFTVEPQMLNTSGAEFMNDDDI